MPSSAAGTSPNSDRADVRRVLEHLPPVLPPGLLDQGGVRVGDGREVPPGVRAEPGGVVLEERGEVVRLGGGARLGRDQVQAALRGRPRGRRGDRVRVGRVQHPHLQPARLHPDHPGEHLHAQAGAAHAAHQHPVDPVGGDRRGELPQPRQLRPHRAGQVQPAEPLGDLLGGGGVGGPQAGVTRPHPRGDAVGGRRLAAGGGHLVASARLRSTVSSAPL
jgi:hypothetical protein